MCNPKTATTTETYRLILAFGFIRKTKTGQTLYTVYGYVCLYCISANIVVCVSTAIGSVTSM